MSGQQPAAIGDGPDAAHAVEAIGQSEGATDRVVRGAASSDAGAAASSPAGCVHEIDFVGAAIGGDDVAVGIERDIAQLSEVVVQGGDVSGNALAQLGAGTKKAK